MKLTKEKQFEIFKAEAEKWIQFFGLQDWSVWYGQEDLTENNSLAESHMNYAGKIASLIINSERTDEHTTVEGIKKSAFHEVCELLLCEMDMVRKNTNPKKKSSAMFYENATHAVIRRLENSVFKQSLEKDENETE